MNMRLLGAKTIKDVVPEMVDARNLHSHLVSVPEDRLFHSNCELSFVRTSLFMDSNISFLDESMKHAQLKAIKSKL